jgi:D-3-phosphoglycerate dehydrogenase
MVVLITDVLDPVCHELLEEAGHTPRVVTDAGPEELIEHVRGAHGWITRSGTDITADLLDAAEDLEVIGRAGVGVDNIDLEAATRRGILVCNAPTGNTLSAAEHTCALLQATARQVPQAVRSLQGGAWERKKFSGTELHEKTLGVIGVGKIGRAVSERMEGFEMEVLGYDPYLSDDVMERLVPEFVTLGELLERSDFVTVHTPRNDETMGLIGADELARCTPSAFVINCARGGIVDEEALLEAVEAERLRGAAVDVYSEEPPQRDELSALIEHPKVVATPHIAASTGAAQEKVARRTARQVIAALKGEAVSSPVNGMGLRMAAQPEARPYLHLADGLGQVASQLGRERLRALTIGCYGEIPPEYTEVLRVAMLRGVLGHQGLDAPVNLVNAPMLAEERDLRVREEREQAPGSFTQLVQVTAEFEGGETHRVAGTVFDGGVEGRTPRLVRVGSHELEMQLDGSMLFYRNVDRPGMLAAVGQILAEADINIASLALSRPSGGRGGAEALTALRVDDPLTPDVIDQVAAMDGVKGVRAVEVR